MKYWMDTEFITAPYSIDLISVGLVAEDGREFYAESSEVDWSKASLWTLKNVRPQLNGEGISREAIGYAVRRFTDGMNIRSSGVIFPPTIGWRSVGCSVTWTNCRSITRNFVSTSNNGRSSWAIRNCRSRRAPGITPCATPDGRAMHGRFSPASIPPPANGAQSAARTPRAQPRADFFEHRLFQIESIAAPFARQPAATLHRAAS